MGWREFGHCGVLPFSWCSQASALQLRAGTLTGRAVPPWGTSGGRVWPSWLQEALEGLQPPAVRQLLSLAEAQLFCGPPASRLPAPRPCRPGRVPSTATQVFACWEECCSHQGRFAVLSSVSSDGRPPPCPCPFAFRLRFLLCEVVSDHEKQLWPPRGQLCQRAGTGLGGCVQAGVPSVSCVLSGVCVNGAGGCDAP